MRHIRNQETPQAIHELRPAHALEKYEHAGHAQLVVICAAQLCVESRLVGDADGLSVYSPELEHFGHHLLCARHDDGVLQHLLGGFGREWLAGSVGLRFRQERVGERELHEAVLFLEDFVVEVEHCVYVEVAERCRALAAVEFDVFGHWGFMALT